MTKQTWTVTVTLTTVEYGGERVDHADIEDAVRDALRHEFDRETEKIGSVKAKEVR